MNNADTKVTTTNITELNGSILIDQLALKPPELIHSKLYNFRKHRFEFRSKIQKLKK